MEHISIDEVEQAATATDVDQRVLAGALGTTDVAVNHYRLQPDDRLSGDLHAHQDQEEVFVVIEGEVTFHTAQAEDDQVTVADGEVVRFGPGEFQTGGNHGEEEAEVIALGAPRDSEDVRVPRICPACDTESVRVVPTEDGTFGFVCPECGEEGDDVDTLENGMIGIGP
ncbi:cupin domain-containing protein [Halobaculum sp. MBLA0143]|uniref:cupin domain-containing protein n=1 Tax=Halobaculum sp. MBLA0143 TaxID=3079933 RepID=UPI003525DDB9